MSNNFLQLSKNLSSANKLIKNMAGIPKESSSKAQNIESKSFDKRKTIPPKPSTKQPTQNKELQNEFKNLKEDEKDNLAGSLKDLEDAPAKIKLIKTSPPVEKSIKAPPHKKFKSELEDLTKVVTSLDKIVNKNENEGSESHQNNVVQQIKTIKKKIGKNIENRQNILYSHDFEHLLRKTEGLSYGDDDYKFKDNDYILIVNENEQKIDTEKFLGEFNNGDLSEELMKRIEWVEIAKISEESRLTKFINNTPKNESTCWRQKIIMGKLNDNSILK